MRASSSPARTCATPSGTAPGEYVSDNALNVYVKRLREKVETDPAAPELIVTVRGLGYKVGE